VDTNGVVRREVVTGDAGVGGSSHPPTQDPSVPLLSMTGITKRYRKVVANDGIDLEVRAGEVLALLGENGAGKSTLMKILFGLEAPDAGEIRLDGDRVRFAGPRQALGAGIGMVHQHFMLVSDMTVAENVALGAHRRARSRLPDVAASVRNLSTRFGFELDPDARIESLSVATRQRVEIVKLLHRGARLLILDEPTASVGPKDWDQLAEILRALADSGAAIIFITHKLDEVSGVADRAVVLRAGRVVGSVDPSVTSHTEMARLMVGRDVVLRVERSPMEPGVPVAVLSEVTLDGHAGRPALDNVSLEVRAGEVVGVAGVEGNGQHELVEVIAGVRACSSGQVRVGGIDLRIADASVFAEAGGGYVPEDRHHDAVALELSVADNLGLRVHASAPFSRFGVLSRRRLRGHAEQLVRANDVRGGSPDTTMRQLSGGNQQKAVLGRELEGEPQLLVVAQPTRGLDVGAMEMVYGRILEHRQRGGATLLVSSDLEELLSLSDRIVVMSRGRIVADRPNDGIDLDEIALLMAGGSDAEPVGEVSA
jgi:ABC-type uncharacterized transport system ATPase subunit